MKLVKSSHFDLRLYIFVVLEEVEVNREGAECKVIVCVVGGMFCWLVA